MIATVTDRQAIDTTAEPAERAIGELVRAFKLLGDDFRLRILFHLSHGELNVTELCRRLAQNQPAVSHHLAMLRVAGIVQPRRQGKHNYYSIRTERFGDLLATLLASAGGMPRKLKFHDFTLTRQEG